MTARRRALVHRAVSGRCVVDQDTLRKRLGKTGWALLVRLWARRDDRTGLTFASDLRLARDLAEQQQHPDPTEPPGAVKRGLKRLRASGLLVAVELGRGTYDGEDGGDGLGWQTIAPYGRVFVRQVLGAPMLPDRAMVPQEVASWMKTHTERRGGSRPNAGGSRPGAGRKRISKTISKSGPNPPAKNQQTGPHIFNTSITGRSSSLRSEEAGAARPATVGPSGARSRENPVPASACPAAPPVPRPDPVAVNAANVQLEAILDAAMNGDGPRPQNHDLPLRVALWPVKSAQRPYPPKMPPDASGPLAVARFVAKVYAAAHLHETGKPYWPFVRPLPPSSPHYPKLLGAGRTFHEEDVRPARWVMWSTDCWHALGRAGMPPPHFVFSPERFIEHFSWFLREERGYATRLDIVGPLEKALAVRWFAMRRAVLLRAPGETGESIVERWFPGDTWERAVAAAQVEATRMQAELDRRVARGDWLWG